LDKNNQLLPKRSQAIHDHKKNGGFIAGVFPIHYPRALFRAFNVLPVEVWGPPGVDPSFGSAHLQPYVCSIVRNALSFLQSGGLEVADILVVPHACDSLQGFGSILIDFVSPPQPVIPIYIPRGRRDCDVEFFASELENIYGRLQSITSLSPTEQDLLDCIQREEKADYLLSELSQQRHYMTQTNKEYYHLIRSREFLPAETFIHYAQTAMVKKNPDTNHGIPILLSGILPEPFSLLDTFTSLGVKIVGDDLACCGRRLYPPGNSDLPFYRMAESIIQAPPDPTRGNTIQERNNYLQMLVNRTGAIGVVFYEPKFCEPELFDLPLIRKGLLDIDIPSIIIEIDINDQLSQQTITRIEAFVEMIR
jgi:benzoyl-CoA reductase/2-hydroxyglutaryl-CoA dehydratase subunit BcrC/BadD/HgdB